MYKLYRSEELHLGVALRGRSIHNVGKSAS